MSMTGSQLNYQKGDLESAAKIVSRRDPHWRFITFSKWRQQEAKPRGGSATYDKAKIHQIDFNYFDTITLYNPWWVICGKGQ